MLKEFELSRFNCISHEAVHMRGDESISMSSFKVIAQIERDRGKWGNSGFMNALVFLVITPYKMMYDWCIVYQNAF